MPKCKCDFPWFPDRVAIHKDSSKESDPIPDYTGDPLFSGIPCRIVPTSGDETFRGRQLEAHITHVVEMRYVSGVTPKMQVNVTGGIYSGRLLNISYVAPMQKIGTPPLLALKCEELVAV